MHTLASTPLKRELTGTEGRGMAPDGSKQRQETGSAPRSSKCPEGQEGEVRARKAWHPAYAS